MAKIKKQKSDKDKHYNWLVGADMYFAASIILCEEMLETYTCDDETLIGGEQKICRKYLKSINNDYEMLMPAVFNLKHGIELYLKALIMIADPDLEYPITHDLLYLLNKSIRTLHNRKIDKTVLDVLDIEVRSILEKYYYGLYAFSHYKMSPDINNEAERFPEYLNPDCYEISNLMNIASKHTLIRNIKSDCENLHKKLSCDVFKKLY